MIITYLIFYGQLGIVSYEIRRSIPDLMDGDWKAERQHKNNNEKVQIKIE